MDVPARRGHQDGVAEVTVGPRCRAGVVDVDLVAVVARAAFQAQRVELPVTDPEQAGIARLRSGDEGLVAVSLEGALRPLQAARPVPAGPRPAQEFNATFRDFVLEHRPNILALATGVGIVGLREFAPRR